MKSCCDDCLACYLDEHTTVRIVEGVITECDSQIEDTPTNYEQYRKEVEKWTR